MKIKMQYDNLPKDLRDNAKFCLWKYEERAGQSKPSKVPYQVNGKRAKTNYEHTFTCYDTVLITVSQYDGLGLGIFLNFSAVDIDHCINDDGSLSETAKSIITLFKDCYIEKSPSGRGLRILFKAGGFKYNVPKYYINNAKIGVEVYVYGATKKFVTITGNVYMQGDVLEASDKLQLLLDMYMLRPIQNKAKSHNKSLSYLSDEGILQKAKVAKNGDVFEKLWNGEIPEGKSHSEADISLCTRLAFWCGKDTTQMDRLFRQSGLMREKWDRTQSGTTYGQITIEKAVASVSDVYSPIGKISQIEAEFDVPGCGSLDELKPHQSPRYGWNDIGNSNLFADYYNGISRYVPERKQWFVYDGKAWRGDTGNLKVMSLCKKLANKLM
ncbi:MAG: nucleoside triphosphatase, partial [Oscillospiraceae bacterium]